MALSIFVKPTDGYTLDGKVDAVPGLHGEVRFKYRPAAPGLQFEHSRNGGDEASAAKILSKQVSDLVAVDDGEPSPPVRLNADQWRTVHANIWRTAWNFVMGFCGPTIEEAEKNSASASG